MNLAEGDVIRPNEHYARHMKRRGRPKSPDILTPREWEVLDLLSAGYGLDEIATRFVVSRETIRSHGKNIKRKLRVHSYHEAIAAARRMRLP